LCAGARARLSKIAQSSPQMEWWPRYKAAFYSLPCLFAQLFGCTRESLVPTHFERFATLVYRTPSRCVPRTLALVYTSGRCACLVSARRRPRAPKPASSSPMRPRKPSSESNSCCSARVARARLRCASSSNFCTFEDPGLGVFLNSKKKNKINA